MLGCSGAQIPTILWSSLEFVAVLTVEFVAVLAVECCALLVGEIWVVYSREEKTQIKIKLFRHISPRQKNEKWPRNGFPEPGFGRE